MLTETLSSPSCSSYHNPPSLLLLLLLLLIVISVRLVAVIKDMWQQQQQSTTIATSTMNFSFIVFPFPPAMRGERITYKHTQHDKATEMMQDQSSHNLMLHQN